MKSATLTHATRDLYSSTRCGLNASSTTRFSTTPTCPTCRRSLLRDGLAALEAAHSNGHPDAARSALIGQLRAELAKKAA